MRALMDDWRPFCDVCRSREHNTAGHEDEGLDLPTPEQLGELTV
jgi:hypothetical protein